MCGVACGSRDGRAKLSGARASKLATPALATTSNGASGSRLCALGDAQTGAWRVGLPGTEPVGLRPAFSSSAWRLELSIARPHSTPSFSVLPVVFALVLDKKMYSPSSHPVLASPLFKICFNPLFIPIPHLRAWVRVVSRSRVRCAMSDCSACRVWRSARHIWRETLCVAQCVAGVKACRVYPCYVQCSASCACYDVQVPTTLASGTCGQARRTTFI
jgi:hypothetical protein